MARYKKNSTPKLTEELIADISLYIQNGAFVDCACAMVNISKDTLYRWLKMAKDSKPNSMYRKLSDSIRRSKAIATMIDLNNINLAARGVPEKFLLDENGRAILDNCGLPIIESYKKFPDWKASVYKIERRERNASKEDISEMEDEQNDKSRMLIQFV